MTPERTSKGKEPTVKIELIRGVPSKIDPLHINGEPYLHFVGINLGSKGLEFYRLSNQSTNYIKGPDFDCMGFFVDNNTGHWERFKPDISEVIKYIIFSSRWPMKSVAQNYKDIMHDNALYQAYKKDKS